jgi:tetratricopeptide (TPR) repeat protein
VPSGGGLSGWKQGVRFFILVSVPPARGQQYFEIAGARPKGTRLKEKDKHMNGPARITALAVILAGMVFSMSGCDRLKARDELNKGVDAYKGTHYEEAIEHFQRATELDPSLPMAKSYLATALAQNIVPGLDTPDNLKTAQQAIAIFQDVLVKDPHDVNSLKQIAGIEFSVKKLDDAKSWQKKGPGRRSEGSRGGLYGWRDRLDTGAPEHFGGAGACGHQ